MFNAWTMLECLKKIHLLEKAGASYVILYSMVIDGDLDRRVRSVLDAFAQ